MLRVRPFWLVASDSSGAGWRPSEQDCAGRHRGERQDSQHPHAAVGQCLVQDQRPGGDRERVCQQGGEAGDRQRRAALVADLE